MTFDLSGKVAIVTGGGRGLGRAIARGFAEHGAQLVLSGRTADTLAATAAELTADFGVDALTHAGDVALEPDVVALRAAALARFGRIDILVNNAGVNPIYKGIERTTLEEWQHILGINLTGTFLCAKHIGGTMAAAGSGLRHQYQLRRRPCRPTPIRALLRHQGRRRTHDQGPRARLGPPAASASTASPPATSKPTSPPA